MMRHRDRDRPLRCHRGNHPAGQEPVPVPQLELDVGARPPAPLALSAKPVHELARQAARRTGATQTSAIETALVRYLATLDAPTETEERQERLTSLLRSIDARLLDADRAAIRQDLETQDYDSGLPA